MSYREWILANWERSVQYQRRVESIQRIQRNLDALNVAIAAAERGETPDHHYFKDNAWSLSYFDPRPLFEAVSDNFLSQMTGQSVSDLRQERWMREALEAEAKQNQRIANFLLHYRDGELYDIEKEWNKDKQAAGEPIQKWFDNSRPDIEHDLKNAQEALANCKPEPIYDWQDSDNRYRDNWSDKSERVLMDMLQVLGFETGADFGTYLARGVHDLAQKHGFLLTIWIGKYGYATCCVAHRAIPKKVVTARELDLWSATLCALLDYIDTHWEALLAEADRRKGIS